MKILHLYAEWKWTGPAEPILNLVKTLAQRGHAVWLGCFTPPADFTNITLRDKARESNLNLVSLQRPRKLTALFALRENINRIEKFLQEQPIDIIHCHSSLDHFYAAKAIRHLHHPPRIIRTHHKGIPLQPSLITNYLIKKRTDGYITLGKRLLEADRQTFGLSEDRSWCVPGAIDLARFNPDQTGNLRTRFGFGENDIVVGIVARIQRHRRFEVLLAGFALVVKTDPKIRLLVVGRGTYARQLAIEPVQKMGLAQNVLFTGYLTDNYVETLNTFDFGVFLVPGSDGSCRAVREMMALAKPVIVSRRGILPEIVQHKVNGLVIDDTPETLAQAIISLSQDKTQRQRLGENARTTALQEFSLDQQATQIEKIYQSGGLPH